MLSFLQEAQVLFWSEAGTCRTKQRCRTSASCPADPDSKGVSLLIDCGANVDARPSHLVQFAKMVLSIWKM